MRTRKSKADSCAVFSTAVSKPIRAEVRQSRGEVSLAVKEAKSTFLVLLLAATLGCSLPGSDTAEPVTPDAQTSVAGAEVAQGGWLPENRTQRCSLPSAPPIGFMDLESRSMPGTLERPLWVGTAPIDDGKIWVLEQGGRIRQLNADQSLHTVLDFSVSRAGNEEGLLGLAFHPSFPESPYVYLYYSAAQPRRSIISRFTFDPSTATISEATEEELLVVEQPYGNHNGGDLHFGPDGYLYISLGDGGGAGDPFGHAQDTTTLLGSILRIDVDGQTPECMRAYRIPGDNPFSDSDCGLDEDNNRAEIWAWGLRNVWRMSFDSVTGLLWAGDVGQDQKEEVSLIEGGLNYGWNPVEADVCYQSGCLTEMFAPPIHSYSHDQGESITGGLVYRGNALQELWGQYVFGDYESGRIWALSEGSEPRLLAESRRKITSFGLGPRDELLIASFDGGIEALVRANPDPSLPPFPNLLSETGCSSITTSDAQAANLLPYFVNYPFWSDGVEKSRYVALPQEGKIRFSNDDTPEFPLGTVIVKNFYLEGSRRAFPIETRLIHREAEYWSAFSYRWNADGTDAELVSTPTNVPLNYQGRSINWQFMERTQCDKCHIQNQGYALGLSLSQLSKPVAYPDGTIDQIAAWVANGFAEREGQGSEPFPAPTTELTPENLTQQARVYLDVNCASCHQPNGRGDAEIDLRATTSFDQMGLCNIRTQRDLVGTQAGYLIKPGEPEESVLFQRLSRRDDQQMPPIGSNELDARGIELIGAWITQLSDCDAPTP